MGSYTSPDALYKPAVGEEGWGLAVDENFDTIQARLSALTTQTETLEALPANLTQDETRFHRFRNSVGMTGIYRYNSGTPIVGTNFNVSDAFWADYSGGVQDPGWLRGVDFTDPTGYWDITFPAGSYFVCPPGRYQWQAIWQAGTNLVSTESYGFTMDTVTQDVNDTVHKDDDVQSYVLANSALSDRRMLLGSGQVEVETGADPADVFTGEETVPFFPYVFVTVPGVVATTLNYIDFIMVRVW